MLRDVPASGWILVAFSALRAGLLAATALTVAHGIDLVTVGAGARGPWVPALALALAAALAAAAETWIPALAQPVEERRWRARVARRTLDDSIDSAVPAGERISRGTEEVERFAHYRATFLGPLVAGAVVPIVVLVAIAVYASWGISLALAVGTALAPVLIGGFLSRVRSSSGRYRAISGRLTGMFLETMRVRHTMRMLGAESSRRTALAQQAKALRDEVMALLRRNQLVILITDAIFGVLALVASAVFAVAGVASGFLTPGIGVALVLLSALLREPVDRLGRSFYVGLAGRAAGVRVRDALAKKPENLASADDAAPPSTTSPDAVLTLRGASIVRGAATPVSGLDLEISARTLTAVVGTSGAGKSTLALAMAGLVPATGILLGSAPATRAELLSSVAYVPQRAVLFPGSVRQNLALAREDATDEDMTRALARAGIDVGRELAHGLDTELGEGSAGVSGGQAQRISIARALMTRRPLLIADEATAHLDPASSTQVLSALRDATRDRTVVMITHRHDEATIADRVVVGDGPPAAVLAGEVLPEGDAR
jgi:ATP-binding cassette subfamily C protein